jgi:hypothetical protein
MAAMLVALPVAKPVRMALAPASALFVIILIAVIAAASAQIFNHGSRYTAAVSHPHPGGRLASIAVSASGVCTGQSQLRR